MSLKPHPQDISAHLVVLACLAASCSAQTGTTGKPAVSPTASVSATPATSGPATTDAPAHPLTAKEQREAQIAADTEKLYQLAQQLKVELDKSNKDTLSLTVMKKAAEIEKLAHSISERMKTN